MVGCGPNVPVVGLLTLLLGQVGLPKFMYRPMHIVRPKAVRSKLFLLIILAGSLRSHECNSL